MCFAYVLFTLCRSFTVQWHLHVLTFIFSSIEGVKFIFAHLKSQFTRHTHTLQHHKSLMNQSLFYYLRQGGNVFARVCLSVCLSVCLLAT